jgi:hypothetical protein
MLVDILCAKGLLMLVVFPYDDVVELLRVPHCVGMISSGIDHVLGLGPADHHNCNGGTCLHEEEIYLTIIVIENFQQIPYHLIVILLFVVHYPTMTLYEVVCYFGTKLMFQVFPVEL